VAEAKAIGKTGKKEKKFGVIPYRVGKNIQEWVIDEWDNNSAEADSAEDAEGNVVTMAVKMYKKKKAKWQKEKKRKEREKKKDEKEK
jgi:hypothetical protein